MGIEDLKAKISALERAIESSERSSLMIAEEIAKMKRNMTTGQGRMESAHPFSPEDKEKLAEMKIKSTGLGEIIEQVYAKEGVDINDGETWYAITHNEHLPLKMGREKNARS